MEIDDVSFNQIINTLKEGLYITNLGREITHWNKYAELISGFSKNDVIGSKCSDNILEHIDEHGNSLCTKNCPLHSSMSDKQKREANVYLKHKNGHRVPVHVETSALCDNSGIIIGGIQIFSELNHLGFKDIKKIGNITKLYNKNYISKHLKDIFSKKNQLNYGILRFDIDNIKQINNDYGMDVGNKMMNIVSNNILAVSRSSDIYGKWGDNEYIGILPEVSSKDLKNIAESIKITTENSSITVNNNKILITLSIGGTLCKKSDYMLNIIERVDNLIFKSKDNGGNSILIG